MIRAVFFVWGRDMRTVSNIMVQTYKGTPFRVAERDMTGEIQWEDKDRGVPVAHPADLRAVLDEIIMLFPREVLTNQDTIHGTRLYNQIHSASDGQLCIEDAEWEWLLKRLEDDKVGPRVFGMNAHSITEQIRSLGQDAQSRKGPRGLEPVQDGVLRQPPNRAERRRRGPKSLSPRTAPGTTLETVPEESE